MFIAVTALWSLCVQTPDPDFERPKFTKVLHALQDGTPDRTKPINSWEEVRMSRRLVFSFSNGLEKAAKTSCRFQTIGSDTVVESEPLPIGAPAFTLPGPDHKTLHINRPKSSFVIRDVEVPSMTTRQVFAVSETRLKVEFRLYRGKEYIRWQSIDGVLRYEEALVPFQQAIKS